MMREDPTHADDSSGSARTATVAVVGAGLAGLTAARTLHRAGVDVLVLEAADRLGGRTMSETTALGSRVDLGGQWIGHDHHRLAALADELGATQFRMHTAPLPTILDGDRRVSLGSPSMLAAVGFLLGSEALSHVHPPQRWNTTTVADWLAKVPGRTPRRLLEVAALTSWTADLDRFSVQAMMTLIRLQGGLRNMMSTTGGAQEGLLVEGVGTLVDGLAGELGPRVHRGHRVTSIIDDDGLTLTTTAGTVHATKAVVTVPLPLLDRITFQPSLPPDRIAAIDHSYMGSVYKAIAVFDRPFWRDRGISAEMLVLGSPGFGVFDTSPPNGPGHLCMLVGGPQARTLDHLDTATRRKTMLGALVTRLGTEVLEPMSWHEKAWHLDDNAGGGYTALPEPGVAPDAHMPVPFTPVGDIHWAGAETAKDHPGYIDGAIESGTRAAHEVLDALSRPDHAAPR